MSQAEPASLGKSSERVASAQEHVADGQNNEAKIRELITVNEQLQKEIRDLLVIGEVARSITSTLLIEEILGEILCGIRETLCLDRVVLGLVHYEGGYEEVKLAIGVSGEAMKKARWMIEEADPVWKRLKDQRMPILVDLHKEKGLPEFIQRGFRR